MVSASAAMTIRAVTAAAGDQPQAIHQLTEGILNGERYQTLLGVTGSGKTFTMANVIQNVQKPTLVLTHNKTLVAQLYGEFKQFFPENAVGYFVSYYDYYQPEAYMPVSNTYIEKEKDHDPALDVLHDMVTVTGNITSATPIAILGKIKFRRIDRSEVDRQASSGPIPVRNSRNNPTGNSTRL